MNESLPGGEEFEQANRQKFKCPGERMLKLQFGWYIMLGPLDLEKPKMILIGSTVKYKIK